MKIHEITAAEKAFSRPGVEELTTRVISTMEKQSSKDRLWVNMHETFNWVSPSPGDSSDLDNRQPSIKGPILREEPWCNKILCPIGFERKYSLHKHILSIGFNALSKENALTRFGMF